MKELEDIVERIKHFEAEVNGLLSKYDSSPARAINLSKTISKLNSLSLIQETLFLEAIECMGLINSSLLKPVHILAWAAMADYLEQWLGEDNFVTVSKKKGNLAEKMQKNKDSQRSKLTPKEKNQRALDARKKSEEYWKFQSVMDLRNTVTEHSIITALRDCGYISKAEMNALQGLLSTRNQCAHPSIYEPNLDEAIGYVSGILNRIGHYEKKREKEKEQKETKK